MVFNAYGYYIFSYSYRNDTSISYTHGNGQHSHGNHMYKKVGIHNLGLDIWRTDGVNWLTVCHIHLNL